MIGNYYRALDVLTLLLTNNLRTLLPMSFPVWRARVSLSVLLNKQDKRSVLNQLVFQSQFVLNTLP